MTTRKITRSDSKGNFGYVTARVRSRRSMLFDEDDYRKLIRMGTGEIARFMEETEYQEEMNELGARYSRVDLIEYALNRNLAKHFEDLLRWSEGNLYDYVARYLRKFDAWNVKTVIRGIYSESSQEAIESDFIRAGEFSDQQLQELLASDSIEAVVERLDGTIFHAGLEEAFVQYEETDLLVPLENAVDRAFYEELLAGLPDLWQADRPTELYLDFLQAEIDFRNVRNALRIAQSGADIDPAAYFIEGGRLFDETELVQLVSNTDELVERIRQSHYGDRLGEALDVLEAAGDLIEFENALDAALLEYADVLSNRYPLSVCPVLAYVIAKEREVDNIRSIARGREAGMTETEIEQELVML